MADMDRYVRAIQDLLGQLGSPAERISAMEEALSRFAAADTRRAAGDFVNDLVATPERMLELRRLLGEFASPGKQLRTFEEQIGITRQQLELLARQLETAESTIGRFADLAEQLAALTEPFSNLATSWRGPEPTPDDPGADEAAPPAP